MSMGLLYWILMLLWLVLWGVGNFGGGLYGHYAIGASGLLLFVLFLLLGWRVFGQPISG